MTLRFHEIAEAEHRILNPFSAEKLDLIGRVLDMNEETRLLDLACGKGEMLARWAQAYGMRGVGVDISDVFIEAARERAYLMDVGDKVTLVVGDAAVYPEPHHEFDIVVCLGATWIGDGLAGTIDLMRQALKQRGGVLVIGEPYWYRQPSADVARALDVEPDTFATLGGTLERFEAAGLELVEMVLADHDEFDRYEASQWLSVSRFLADNPDDPDADALREWSAKNRRAYMYYGREYMGWGVFVLRLPDDIDAPAEPPPTDHNAPVGVEINDGMLWVRLGDGRVIGNPLTWYAWLESAPPALQHAVEMHDGWLEWPSLNGQIRIVDLLKGRR